MASFNDSLGRHRSAINKKDSKRFNGAFHTQLERQPTAEELESGNVFIHEDMGLSERTLESREDLDSRAKSAQDRSRANWKLLEKTQRASNMFNQHGRNREQDRPDASMWNPIEYGKQMATGNKPISKEEQVLREKAATASNKRSYGTGHRLIGAKKRRAMYNVAIQLEKVKTKILARELESKPGYYFGTTRDIFWWKAFDKAEEDGEADPDTVADIKYYEKYPNEIHRPQTQFAVAQERQTPALPRVQQTSSRPSVSVIPALEFSEEFMESEGHPDYIIDPISREPMVDPVVLENGMSYERESITEWFFPKNRGIHSGSNLDPMTNEKLKSKKMAPNMSLRHAIMEYYNVWNSNKNAKPVETMKKTTKKTAKKTTKNTTKTQKNNHSETKTNRDLRREAAEKRNKKHNGGRTKTRVKKRKKSKTKKIKR